MFISFVFNVVYFMVSLYDLNFDIYCGQQWVCRILKIEQSALLSQLSAAICNDILVFKESVLHCLWKCLPSDDVASNSILESPCWESI